MANDTLILIAGAAASYYLLTQEKAPSVPNVLTIDILEANNGGPSIEDGGNMPITGINGPSIGVVTFISEPNYITWNRPQWSAYLMANINETDLETASALVWDKWDNSRNEMIEQFPSLDALMFNLITYQTRNNIGVVITADSVPVYGTISNRWNNIHYWVCDEWRQWYDLNAQKYGAATAKAKFWDAWSHDDNQSIWSWEAMGYSCGYDCDFTNYFRSKGIDVANWGTENTCTLIDIPSNLLDAGAAVSEGVKNTANTVSFLMPVTLIALTGIFVYSQYQKIQ